MRECRDERRQTSRSTSLRTPMLSKRHNTRKGSRRPSENGDSCLNAVRRTNNEQLPGRVINFRSDVRLGGTRIRPARKELALTPMSSRRQLRVSSRQWITESSRLASGVETLRGCDPWRLTSGASGAEGSSNKRNGLWRGGTGSHRKALQ